MMLGREVCVEMRDLWGKLRCYVVECDIAAI